MKKFKITWEYLQTGTSYARCPMRYRLGSQVSRRGDLE